MIIDADKWNKMIVQTGLERMPLFQEIEGETVRIIGVFKRVSRLNKMKALIENVSVKGNDGCITHLWITAVNESQWNRFTAGEIVFAEGTVISYRDKEYNLKYSIDECITLLPHEWN